MAHHFVKNISLQLVALFWLLGLPMAVESVDLRSGPSHKRSTGSERDLESGQVPHAVLSEKSDGVTTLAQSDTATFILPPWSDRDVRQGTREAVQVIPRGPSKPEAFPTDLRRSSAPNKDAIPLIQRTSRDGQEGKSPGNPDEKGAGESAAKSTARESFMTVHPFSDVDVRQGSRRQQNPTTQPVTTSAKPAIEVPVKEQKGFFGRMLEKAGF